MVKILEDTVRLEEAEGGIRQLISRLSSSVTSVLDLLLITGGIDWDLTASLNNMNLNVLSLLSCILATNHRAVADHRNAAKLLYSRRLLSTFHSHTLFPPLSFTQHPFSSPWHTPKRGIYLSSLKCIFIQGHSLHPCLHVAPPAYLVKRFVSPSKHIFQVNVSFVLSLFLPPWHSRAASLRRAHPPKTLRWCVYAGTHKPMLSGRSCCSLCVCVLVF